MREAEAMDVQPAPLIQGYTEEVERTKTVLEYVNEHGIGQAQNAIGT